MVEGPSLNPEASPELNTIFCQPYSASGKAVSVFLSALRVYVGIAALSNAKDCDDPLPDTEIPVTFVNEYSSSPFIAVTYAGRDRLPFPKLLVAVRLTV